MPLFEALAPALRIVTSNTICLMCVHKYWNRKKSIDKHCKKTKFCIFFCIWHLILRKTRGECFCDATESLNMNYVFYLFIRTISNYLPCILTCLNWKLYYWQEKYLKIYLYISALNKSSSVCKLSNFRQTEIKDIKLCQYTSVIQITIIIIIIIN